MPKPTAIGSERRGAYPLEQRRDVGGQPVAHARHTKPRNDIQKPSTELGRPSNPRIGRRRAYQEDRIQAGIDEWLPERLRLLDRVVQNQHAIDSRVGCGPREGLGVHSQDRIGVGEEHDRRLDG